MPVYIGEDQTLMDTIRVRLLHKIALIDEFTCTPSDFNVSQKCSKKFNSSDFLEAVFIISSRLSIKKINPEKKHIV